MTNTNQEARREKEKEVAAKIEAILTENSMALQPFLAFSEFGVVPRVRLVDTKESTNDGETETEPATEGDREPDGAAELEQS